MAQEKHYVFIVVEDRLEYCIWLYVGFLYVDNDVKHKFVLLVTDIVVL